MKDWDGGFVPVNVSDLLAERSLDGVWVRFVWESLGVSLMDCVKDRECAEVKECVVV